MTEQEKQWHEEPKNWKLGIFYFNKEDNRVFVPKRAKWTGITINFAHRKAYWAILGMIIFFGAVLFTIEYQKHKKENIYVPKRPDIFSDPAYRI